jgi:hypothetical protein
MSTRRRRSLMAAVVARLAHGKRIVLQSAVLTAILGLFAAPVWAECAWVLWNEISFLSTTDSRGSSFNTIIAAVPTYERCEQDRFAKAQQLLRERDDSDKGPNVEGVSVKEQGNMIIRETRLKDGGRMARINRLSCLPDTIDPRGPKGDR